MTSRPRRYEVRFINSSGRIIRTENFSQDERSEAVAFQQRHAHEMPGARGWTIWQGKDGDSEQSGII